MKEITEKHTIPLLYDFENHDDELQPEFEGCGVFFHHLDNFFILSVEHVFERACSSGEKIYIPFNNEMTTFHCDILCDKRNDIAIAKICPDDIFKFCNYTPINITDIVYCLGNQTNEIFLSGFPCAGVEFNPQLSSLGYTYYSGWLRLHQEQMECNKDKIHSTIFINYPSNWVEMNLYHPKGMSGSGVWVDDKNGDPKLCGINYLFDGTDCIHAHRIHLFVEIIKQKFDNKIIVPDITKVKLMR